MRRSRINSINPSILNNIVNNDVLIRKTKGIYYIINS